MSIETLFFIVTALVAFIPTIWPMKVEEKNLNWWKSLTLAGRAYIISFVFFFGTGLYLTISSHYESVIKEIKSKKRIESDSLSMSNLTIKVNELYRSDSTYRSKYDSLNRIIIKTGESSIVNTGNLNNNSHQNTGDISVNELWKLSANDKKKLKELTRKYKYAKVLTCIQDDDSFHFVDEVRAFLKLNGLIIISEEEKSTMGDYNVIGYLVNPESSMQTGNYDNLSQEIQDQICEVLIGFKPKN